MLVEFTCEAVLKITSELDLILLETEKRISISHAPNFVVRKWTV